MDYNLLLPDRVLGNLLKIYFRLKFPYKGKLVLRLGSSVDNPQLMQDLQSYYDLVLSELYETNHALTIETFESLDDYIGELKKTRNKKRLAEVVELKKRLEGKSSSNKKDFLINLETYKIEQEDSKVLKLIEHDHPAIIKTFELNLVFTLAHIENTCSYINEYLNAYKNGQLYGQEGLKLPHIIAKEIVDKINSTDFIKNYGYKNIVIKDCFMQFHSIAYLSAQNKISVREIDTKNNKVVIDNLMQANTEGNTPQDLPDDCVWINEVAFKCVDKIIGFDQGDKNGEYFRLLTSDYYGMYYPNDEAAIYFGCKPEDIRRGHKKNLVARLKKEQLLRDKKMNQDGRVEIKEAQRSPGGYKCIIHPKATDNHSQLSHPSNS